MKKLLSKANIAGYVALVIASILTIINLRYSLKPTILSTLSLVFYIVALIMFIGYLVWRLVITKEERK